MNYIDEIAWRIYRVGTDPTAPIGERDMMLYRIYAVLALAKGETTTLRDVHDAWSAWTATVFPEHRSLIPFDDLTRETQELDRPYVNAIHVVARQIQLAIRD